MNVWLAILTAKSMLPGCERHARHSFVLARHEYKVNHTRVLRDTLDNPRVRGKLPPEPPQSFYDVSDARETTSVSFSRSCGDVVSSLIELDPYHCYSLHILLRNRLFFSYVSFACAAGVMFKSANSFEKSSIFLLCLFRLRGGRQGCCADLNLLILFRNRLFFSYVSFAFAAGAKGR